MLGHDDDEYVSDYLDLAIIQNQTKVVGSLLFGPFIVLTLMILSRVDFFDNWNWPPSLIIILSALGGYLLICVLLLRREAERARTQAIQRLRAEAAMCDDQSAWKRGRIDRLIEDIRALRGGAFSHWLANPALQAVLVPFGGIGAVNILNMLANPAG